MGHFPKHNFRYNENNAKASESLWFLCDLGILNLPHPVLHFHTQAWKILS